MRPQELGIDCVKAFSETEFHDDLKKFDVPTLLMHGDDDQVVPIDISSRKSAKLIKGAVEIYYPGLPHGLTATHADLVDRRPVRRVLPDKANEKVAMNPARQRVEDVIAALGSDGQRGLSKDAARSRLEQYGANELASERAVPAWRRFVRQFQDVLVILLLVATAISAGLWALERDAAWPYEAIAIFAIVLLNAALGYIQESRAEAAIAALRAMSAAHATVIRDGARRSISAAEIVPGDIVLVEEGDTIAADARLIESAALQTAEAALTGESLPVAKDTAPIGDDVPLGDRHNMVFSGTAVTYGHGKALVTATGMRTEMGRIAGLLKETPDEPTPLQRELDRTGKVLGLVVIAIAVVMIVTIILVEDVRGAAALFEVLILGVALAVAAVPEGLPAVVTAVLSIGVQRMAQRNAIVRHLAAVETLGSATVIASDKTGTLTRNEMTVRMVVTASGRVTFEGSGYAPEGTVRADGGKPIEGALRVEIERALAVADRANNASVQQENGRWTVQGDPTEGALLVAARKCGLSSEALNKRLPRVGEVPFSSERKLMSTIHRDTEQEHARHRVHQGRARRAAGAMRLRGGRRRTPAPHARTSYRDSEGQRSFGRRGAADAWRRWPLAASKTSWRTTPPARTSGWNRAWCSPD